MKTKLSLVLTVLLLNTIILTGRSITLTTSGNDTLAVTTLAVSLPLAEEESYVNDIPFDTKEVALKALFFNLEKPSDEAYIDDIPFSTENVAATYNYNALNLLPEEEEYIDDIPFNTADVAEDYILNGCGIAAHPSDSGCAE